MFQAILAHLQEIVSCIGSRWLGKWMCACVVWSPVVLTRHCLRPCRVRTYYFGLNTRLHTTQAHICQSKSYQCSTLTPEDGQGMPETCRVAKIKWKNLLKLTSSWLFIYNPYICIISLCVWVSESVSHTLVVMAMTEVEREMCSLR
jgi:hypothetical protein